MHVHLHVTRLTHAPKQTASNPRVRPGGAAAAFDPSAIDPRSGVDGRALLRSRDAAFSPDEGEGEEAEDAAAAALKTVAKGVTKVGRGWGQGALGVRGRPLGGFEGVNNLPQPTVPGG